nr:MAG TPA: hypothetical protein [Caudoviricetes sp.]
MSMNIQDAVPPVVDLIEKYQGSLNLRNHLDEIVRKQGYGNLSSIVYHTVRGFNYLRHGQQFVQKNQDGMGYTFFTRPILNLTYDNLSHVDMLLPIRDAHPDSYANLARCMLDPWFHKDQNQNDYNSQINHTAGNTLGDKNFLQVKANKSTRLADPYNPFIPFLTNTLVSLTGWRDIALNDYTSKSGVNNEQWSKPDGFYYKTESFELSASFRNIKGNPLKLLFNTWLCYMWHCLEGDINPYPQFVEEREYDFNTRIYRFVMDPTKTYIQSHAMTIAWPMSYPMGNLFNFSADKNFVDGNDEINITFKCMGSDYDHPIMPYEFNAVVGMFNPNLEVDYTNYDFKTQSLVMKRGNWRKLQAHEKNRGVFAAIPLVNYKTLELEWWISPEDYEQYVKGNDKENKPIITDKRSSSNNFNRFSDRGRI